MTLMISLATRWRDSEGDMSLSESLKLRSWAGTRSGSPVVLRYSVELTVAHYMIYEARSVRPF